MKPGIVTLFLLALSVSGIARAEYWEIDAGDVNGLIAAFEGANDSNDEWNIIVLKGEGSFLFSDDYQNTGLILPPLVETQVAMIVDEGPISWDLDYSQNKDTGGINDVWVDILRAAFVIANRNVENENPDVYAQQLLRLQAGLRSLGEPNPGNAKSIINQSVVLLDSVAFNGQQQGSIDNRNYSSIGATDTRIVAYNVDSEFAKCTDGCISAHFTQPPPPLPNLAGLRQALRAAPISDPEDFVESLDRLIALADKGDVVVSNSRVSTRVGGSVFISGPAHAHIEDSLLDNPEPDGFISRPAVVEVRDVATARVERTVLKHLGHGPTVESSGGSVSLSEVTIDGEDVILCRASCSVDVEASILGDVLVDDQLDTTYRACEVDSFSSVTSKGYNIVADDSCGLSGPGDRNSVAPRLVDAVDSLSFPTLADNSPALDAIPFSTGVCGLTDIRGVARYQDGDGNGSNGCDIGALEMTSGGDLRNAHSAAYYDPSRDGEGIFLELLPDGRALVAKFTYRPDGSGPAWFIGVGQVVGNSVIIESMAITDGASFGDAFDPADVEASIVGSLTLSFPTCPSTDSPGQLIFRAANGSGYSDLAVDARRLTTILQCGGGGGGFAQSGRSGSFYAPSRDGEGIFLQWLPSGQVVVIWYTYDANNRQFWMIAGESVVDGDTVTSSMVYPSESTRFGLAFNANEIVFTPWGTVTIRYIDCDTIEITYESNIPGFGSGVLTYSRLTTLKGTTCDL